MKKVICEYEQMRLDRYLRKLYSNFSQGLLEKMLRNKHILLNGNKTSASSRITKGDEILISERYFFCDAKKNIIRHDSNIIKKYVIYEDANMVAINKPCGLASQGGKMISFSVDDYIKLNGYYMVHRLDKNTSGIMLIAKTQPAAIDISKAFAEHIVKKKYVAVITSELTQTIVDSPVDGKSSITEFELSKHSGEYYLIFAYPKTGRKHQIRKHLHSIGSPILGDEKYYGTAHQRMMLHSLSISIGKIKINTEIPKSF